MSRLARRGKTVFLVLVTLLIGETLFGVARTKELLMVQFGRVAPTIPVTDIDRALRFYGDVLGFEVAFTNGNPVSFAVIQQGAAQLHLRVQTGTAGSTHAHLMVDRLDDVCDALVRAGIPLLQPPTMQSWGLRDLVVADPDGNTFEIAEPA